MPFRGCNRAHLVRPELAVDICHIKSREQSVYGVCCTLQRPAFLPDLDPFSATCTYLPLPRVETLAATIRDCIKSDQDIYVIQPAQMFRFWPNTDDETRFKQIQT